MTATQAPTPGPLTDSEQVAHLAKTLDKSPDEIRRALASLESKGLIRLAPTAPVEASGSEREAAGSAEPQVGRAVYERIEKLLTTNPQGWEREYLCHLVESVEEVGGYDGPGLDGRNDRQAVADFLKLRDESVGHSEVDDAERLESADAILALLSARPLALGGQQGVDRGRVEAIVREAVIAASVDVPDKFADRAAMRFEITQNATDAIVSALSTTPARAEAQDEGAAGSDCASCFGSGKDAGSQFNACPDCDGKGRIARAHPSPTPAADADRVRAWDAFAAHINWELSHGYPDGEEEDGCWLVHSVNGGRNDREWTLIGRGETPLDAALAALKSEGK